MTDVTFYIEEITSDDEQEVVVPEGEIGDEEASPIQYEVQYKDASEKSGKVSDQAPSEKNIHNQKSVKSQANGKKVIPVSMNIKPEEPLFKWKWMSLSGRPASKNEVAKFNNLSISLTDSMEKVKCQDYLAPVPESENPLPTGRGGASFCKVGEDIYLFGGADRFQACYGDYMHIFNTKSLTWRLETGLLNEKNRINKEVLLQVPGISTQDTNIAPSPRSGHSCTYWKENDSLFFFGGINFQEEKCFNDSYIYHLPTKLWYKVTNLLKQSALRKNEEKCDSTKNCNAIGKETEILSAAPENEDKSSTFCKPPKPPAMLPSCQKFEEIVSGRNSHSCVNLTENRMLIYGGACEDGVLDEVFLVQLHYSSLERKYYATWEALKRPTKEVAWPGAREMHAACSYEQKGIIISGGRAEDGSVYKDIWMLIEIPSDENQLSSDSKVFEDHMQSNQGQENTWKWIKMETDLCNPICAHTMTLYQAATSSSSILYHDGEDLKKMSNISLVLFGGFDGLTTIHNEIQVLPLSYSKSNTVTSRDHITDFQSLSITGETSSTISSLLSTTEAGGENHPSFLRANGGWLYKGEIGYSPIGGPEARFAHSMVYDQSEERLYIFGGVNIQQDMEDVIILKGIVSEKKDRDNSPGRKE